MLHSPLLKRSFVLATCTIVNRRVKTRKGSKLYDGRKMVDKIGITRPK